MTFKPTSFDRRNNRSRFSRWYLPSSGSPTFHSTQVRTVLKPKPLILSRSSFQSLGESFVIVSSIGARAFPPLYQTETGKKDWFFSDTWRVRNGSDSYPAGTEESLVEA